MKIYDISHDLFSATVFPGDPKPSYHPVRSIANGDPCNLSLLELGSHNGSHMDAPRHFYADGRTIDQVDLYKCVGLCTLIEHTGVLGRLEIEALTAFSMKRLLIKGDITITVEAAEALVEYDFEFLGVEGLTVGAEDTSKAVHRTLLQPEAELVIAENLNLSEVPVGEYFLVCVPLKLGGLDGSPCRAILIQEE
ncbi:MAG: cyclase [Lachnospiraceae bacterium]|jgi:arylformamidase|nr:cyclase [Lachnospiraceae bacterium]